MNEINVVIERLKIQDFMKHTENCIVCEAAIKDPRNLLLCQEGGYLRDQINYTEEVEVAITKD